MSAGGYLAYMIGLDKSYLEKHEIDANNIAALIPFYRVTQYLTLPSVKKMGSQKHSL